MAKTRKEAEEIDRTSPEVDAEGRTVIRVRRGALRRFELLKRKSEGLPVVIAWDRRVDNRRTPGQPATHDVTAEPDRRKRERRQEPPFTWGMADFVVVGDRARTPAPERESPPRKRRTRSGR